MSKTLRFNALLVRALAIELGQRLDGARVHTGRFDAARRTIRLATGRGTLVWDLRPTGRGPRLLPAAREEGNLPIPAGSHIRDFRALPDERILEISIGPEPPDEPTGVALVVLELFGPHSNAFALDRDGVILALLREGGASRPATRGATRVPPAPSGRAGIDAPPGLQVFREVLRAADGEARRRALIERVAWTSPLNAGAILGPEDATPNPETSYRTYLEVRSAAIMPLVLDPGGAAQPYPRPLPGMAARPTDDLLAAFTAADDGDDQSSDAAAVLGAIASRRDAVLRRLDRLRAQLEGATVEAERSRQAAALLLSQPHAVRKGMTAAELDDFVGGRVRVELEPALNAAANAERLYDLARRRERAARRIPPMLQAGEREAERLASLETAIGRGDVPVSSVPPVLKRTDGAGAGKERVLPYRRYRSRNGLEIRVGRNARANDELTFRHSRPDDIWLHARDVAGAHVVLSWGRRDQNPPEQDVRDAAVLAALHSRGRTSGTVPVDWTRRKYVRKPRKTAPGVVVLERGKTLFVEPDAALERRLRDPAVQP